MTSTTAENRLRSYGPVTESAPSPQEVKPGWNILFSDPEGRGVGITDEFVLERSGDG